MVEILKQGGEQSPFVNKEIWSVIVFSETHVRMCDFDVAFAWLVKGYRFHSAANTALEAWKLYNEAKNEIRTEE